MDKLVVIAEKEELKLVEELGYGNWQVLITGVGGMNVIKALKDLPKDMTIVNIGYAGSKNLEPGKYYSIERVSLYHQNVDYPEKPVDLSFHFGKYEETGLIHNAIVPCYTSNDFVLDTDRTGCVFDMELAYIATLGFKTIISFKYVSDNLDLQEYREKFNEK